MTYIDEELRQELNISTHTSLRDVTIIFDSVYREHTISTHTSLRDVTLYMVRDNFQTTKYSNSKQNIITLNTKVPKIIAKRVVFSAKASDKRATLHFRLPMYKIVVILPQPI